LALAIPVGFAAAASVTGFAARLGLGEGLRVPELFAGRRADEHALIKMMS
jgi:hypothetical protein